MMLLNRAALRRSLLGSALLLGVTGLTACGGDGPAEVVPPPVDPDPLRALAEPHGLRIGTAVGSNFFNQDQSYIAILRREFNILTAENEMKFGPLRPSRDSYRWEQADALVDFAAANGMQVRGHALAWHSQNPQWLTAGSWTRQEARTILEEHITTVVGRYRGRIVAWDVVNEAVDDQGNRRTAQSVWEQTIGGDYVDLAFQAAHAADPGALLFYNDYNLEWPGAKQDAVFNLVSDLRQRGVPVHGIGFQAHFISGGGVPSEQVLRTTFDRFAALGLRIHLTELDIRIQLPATAEKLETQAAEYRRVVKACLDHPACDTVVVWGLHDGNSWVPQTFPGQGAALLFDANFNRKPAYFAVNELLAGR